MPLFFAIAGWVVLVGAPPRDGARLRRRIVRIVVPLAVWTVLYLAWGKLRDTNDDPVRELALDSLFASVRPAYHLWYLYAYLPVIMVLGLVVLVRAGKRPWGLGAVLLVLASAPSFLGDLAEATGRELPRFGWAFAPYQLIYAVLGALLLAAPAGAFGRRRWPWLLLAAGGLAGVIAYQHEVHYAIPYARTSWWPCSAAGSSCRCTAYGSRSGCGHAGPAVRGVVRGLPGARPRARSPHRRLRPGGPGRPARRGARGRDHSAATTALSFGAALLWGRAGARQGPGLSAPRPGRGVSPRAPGPSVSRPRAPGDANAAQDLSPSRPQCSRPPDHPAQRRSSSAGTPAGPGPRRAARARPGGGA